MNSMDGDCHVTSQDSAVTACVGPVGKDSSVHNHGDKVKMLNNSTPNGYSEIPNHKSKSDGHHKKHHDGSSKSHSDASKHNSDHHKKKDSNDINKHKDKHSHSSKSKDSSSIPKEHKTHSSKPGDSSSQSKEHVHSKEKKHHSSEKTKDSSGKAHADHSKHPASEKKDSDKIKTEVKKEHKTVEEKSKLDNFKENNKLKDGKVKEKHKDGQKEKHKEIKEKDKFLKDKNKEEKHKEEKHKEAKDVKHKSDSSKEHKVSKDKIKSSDSHKEKPKEKSKESTSEKSEKHDVTKDKPKVISSPVKSSEDFKTEKKSVDRQVEKKPVKVKVELPSPSKVKEEPMSDDDVPLSARKPAKEKPIKIKREKEESDDEPLASRAEKRKKVKTEAPNKRKAYDDDDDEDYDYKKPTKKVKKEKEKPKKPQQSHNVTATASPKKRGKAKEEEQEVWKWWEEEKLEEGVKWKTLEHNGPVFAPPYERVPKNVKFYYDGKHMELSEVAEEVAGFYGRMLDHDYVTKKTFNDNFFKDWRKVMTPEERATITDLKKCRFNAYNDYYKMKTEERKAMTKEEKLVIKQQNEALTQKYGFCIIDSHRQKIGNFKIEPPGLFRGRGEHPKMGMLKRRVHAEDIIINLGREAPVPTPPDGHKWKEVRHDNTVTWLASWNENILNTTKYIMLNPSSKLKGEKDWQKYETARKLKNHADRIRNTYSEDFKSKEMKVRQRAVALYFIDKLALRAGNEKDEDTADTVGCCSLRVEHITLHEEKNGQNYVVDFDFLGKDSIRYENSVAVEKRAYKNVKLFMENKQPGDDLFDRLNTGILNKYLNELMEGLTAKVFRTYNASKTLQEQLDQLTKPEMSIPEKLLAYNRANRAVAVLCNHQRAVPKGFSKSMDNLKTKMEEKQNQIKDVARELKKAKQEYKNSNASKDKIVFDKKKKRLQQLEEQLKKLEVQALDKEENKQIALGTSKLNYLDPRISVAWCKKWEVPIEKIYNRTQRDKFRWAIEMVGPDYKF